MYITIIYRNKEAINLKKSKEGYMREFEGRKGKEKTMELESQN